jgi:hypothetical protein
LVGCTPPAARRDRSSSTTTAVTGVTTPESLTVIADREQKPTAEQPSLPQPDTDAPAATIARVETPEAGVLPPATAEVADLAPIEIQLPAPAFRGTPVPIDEPNVETPRGEPRPPFLAPRGTVNLALGRPVTCSDPAPTAGEVDLVTNGDKEASDFGYLELRPGAEWVQIDLGERSTIYAVLVWHNHAEARVYRDVVVQVSDDADFLDAVTVYNSDHDNSSGLGIGSDLGYVETSEGKLIDCRGVEARYVRLYSQGSHIDDKNHYTEVEIYGRPAA